MSVEELEKVWDTKILDEKRFKPKNYYPLAETDFYFKPYKSEKDAFYVERTECVKGNSDCCVGDATIFKVKPTKEYLKMHGTLFSDNEMTDLLPSPNVTLGVSEPSSTCAFLYLGTDESNCGIYSYPAWKSIDNCRSISVKNSNEAWFEVNSLIPNKSYEKVSGALSEDASAMAKNTPCRGLKAVNDIDDLLYQFYINFDSDCLFTLSIAELEKIWGLKISNSNITITGDGYKSIPLGGLYEEFIGVSADNPEIENNKHSIYVSGDGDFGVEVYATGKENKIQYFTIRMTKAHKKKQDTFFPNNKIYPIFLPTPETKMRVYFVDPKDHYRELKGYTPQAKSSKDLKSSPPPMPEASEDKNSWTYGAGGWPVFDSIEDDKSTEEKSSSFSNRCALLNPYHFLFNSNKTRKIRYEKEIIIMGGRVDYLLP
jgi:hypothetical protein